MAISTKEELQFLLHRGIEIEKKFESFSAWKGFVTLDSANRKAVLTLAGDSHKHRLDLEKMLEILGLEAPTDEIPNVKFDFEGMLDAEILQKIVEQDKIVADLYRELVEQTDPKLVAVLFGEKNVEFYYQTLNRFITDENRHVGMVQVLSGRITRIL